MSRNVSPGDFSDNVLKAHLDFSVYGWRTVLCHAGKARRRGRKCSGHGEIFSLEKVSQVCKSVFLLGEVDRGPEVHVWAAKKGKAMKHLGGRILIAERSFRPIRRPRPPESEATSTCSRRNSSRPSRRGSLRLLSRGPGTSRRPLSFLFRLTRARPRGVWTPSRSARRVPRASPSSPPPLIWRFMSSSTRASRTF